jgi:cobalt-precorrin-5B (C1)-methyltransferase
VKPTILDLTVEVDSASCAVRKDSGDDPDITNGMLMYARVERTDAAGIDIVGGEGVGRVTRKGLHQPVGAAANNPVPRPKIAREGVGVCDELRYKRGLRVVVSIPGGAEAASRTFNPRLGIEGGLSILGTSGIVEPMASGRWWTAFAWSSAASSRTAGAPLF